MLSELSKIVGEAFAAEGVDHGYGGVVVSQRPELAQFQANGAMAAAKVAGTSPRDLAQKIVDRLAANPTIALFSRNGFTEQLLAAAKARTDLLLVETDRLVDDLITAPP